MIRFIECEMKEQVREVRRWWTALYIHGGSQDLGWGFLETYWTPPRPCSWHKPPLNSLICCRFKTKFSERNSHLPLRMLNLRRSCFGNSLQWWMENKLMSWIRCANVDGWNFVRKLMWMRSPYFVRNACSTPSVSTLSTSPHDNDLHCVDLDVLSACRGGGGDGSDGMSGGVTWCLVGVWWPW